MASEVVSKLQSLVTGESKGARKKKGRSEAVAAAVPAASELSASEAGAGSSQAPGNANGTDSDNSYLRELQKNIRNINKKLNATQKVDAILAANPGVSLDDLVATRKINNDQKAQAEKKPGLQAQLAQYEEQYGHYRKYGEEFEAKFTKEKEQLSQAHADEVDALRDTVKAEAALEQHKVVKDKLLAFSRFLRAAAARRALEEDESDLSKGFEGALLQVYGGDAAAVVAAEKLIDGSDEKIPSVEGVELDVTYSQVKQAVLEEAPFAAEEAWVDDVAQSQPAPPDIEAVSDPTLVNAGLTEMSASATTIAEPVQHDASDAPAASSIEPNAANAAAAEQWDKPTAGADDPLSESFEIIPRDPTETETPHVAAAVTSTQSWADDTPEPAAASISASGPAAGNDGFSEVNHSRGGGRGRGAHPSGERGGYRGRGRGGQRGEFRGGRGGGRGGRGEFRGRGGGFRGGAPRGESS